MEVGGMERNDVLRSFHENCSLPTRDAVQVNKRFVSPSAHRTALHIDNLHVQGGSNMTGTICV